MSEQPFLLSDPGEGLTEAEIVSWKVSGGDVIAPGQVLVEVETAKSLVEIPSPFEGVVKRLVAKPGDMVPVGGVLLIIELADLDVEPELSATPEPSGANLVGYGAANKARSRRFRAAAAPASGEPKKPSPAKNLEPVSGLVSSRPLAKPPVRHLARELSIDLTGIVGTGPSGSVTREDVLAKAGSVGQVNASTEGQRERYIPVKSLRRQTARAMTASAFTVPHVSIFVDVDVTRTVHLVKAMKASPEYARVKVSPLLVLCRALLWAVKRNPLVNSSWAEDQIVVHNYVNMGVAAATPRGLIVPNIKEAQSLNMLDLARAIERLAALARSGHTKPADVTGGTITVTNVGVFGVDTGTPILNPGESTIVVMGTIKLKPWVVDGEVHPRHVTTLGGSFDHRVMDGDVASRFLSDMALILEEPALLIE